MNNIFLGMKVPTSEFSVNDVKEMVGGKKSLHVLDVKSQQTKQMTLKKFTNYYQKPVDDRKKLLNVISLEVSDTKLDDIVKRPEVVNSLDWIDLSWPKDLSNRPKVQKYCLMSVQGCYTDFHIDFGGTSVWYHIIKGKKIYW